MNTLVAELASSALQTIILKSATEHNPAGPSGRLVWGIGLDHLDAETLGSNPTSGMDIFPHLFVIIHLSAYHEHCVV
jgi:hypothetical protein